LGEICPQILDVLEAVLKGADAIGGLVKDNEKKSIRARIAAARAHIKAPIDPSVDDAARHAELERILKGHT